MKSYKDYEEMKNKELFGLARRKYNIKCKGLKKENVIELIMKEDKARAEAYEEAKNNARGELGLDYPKAVQYWKSVHSKKKVKTEEFEEVTREWKFLSMISEKEMSGDIDEIYLELKGIFCPNDPIIESMEEKKEFILSYTKNFIQDTTSEVLKKGTYSILKLNIDDLEYDENGNLFFDSSKAVRLDNEDITEISRVAQSTQEERTMKSVMRYVKTSEDSIYRLVKDKEGKRFKRAIMEGKSAEEADKLKGLELITINMEPRERVIITNDLVEKKLREKRRKVFKEGFTDIATKTHFLFGFQNASAKRQANFTFVEADEYQQVYQLWYEITGTSNYKNFQKAFKLDKGGNFSKVLTRISSRGSNNLGITRLGDEVDIDLRHVKVLNIPDKFTVVKKSVSKIMSPGVNNMLVEQKDKERELTASDGSILISFDLNARWSRAFKIFNGTDYTDFTILWNNCDKNASKANGRLKKLVLKSGRIWQIRGGEECAQSYKGIAVTYNFENIVATLSAELAEELNKLNATDEFHEGQKLCLGDYDMIVPESVRKYMIEGQVDSEYNFEICNHLKKKGDWVCMNPQFNSALSSENPNIFTPILEYWINRLYKAFDSVAELQQIMNIVSYTDEEEEGISEEDTNVSISDALIANYKLADDYKILKDYQPKFEKLLKEMQAGRIRVPGMYTYMIYDPAHLINTVFNTKEHCLKSGQYYHNGKTCRAGLFRSPLVAPFQAQRVQLTNDENYWYYKDTIVFNGYDGIWDAMGGADFDGDTCAVVCDDDRYGFGKIIVDAIRDMDYDVCIENAPKAQNGIWREDYNDDLIEYLVNNSERDKTGEITNDSTRLLDISNHLMGIKYFADMYECKKVRFLHPKVFGKKGTYKGKDYGYYGCQFLFNVITENNVKVMEIRGIVPVIWDNESKEFIFFNEKGILGDKTLDEVTKLSNDKLVLVDICSQYQMIEIDGAKTGVHAADMGYNETLQTDSTATWFFSRQIFLGRKRESEIRKTDMLTSYRSLSIMGRIYDYMRQNSSKVLDRFKQGTSKVSLLKSLMSDEELRDIHKTLNFEGKNMSLIDYIAFRKTEYNKFIRAQREFEKAGAFSEEESILNVIEVKKEEAKGLKLLAQIAGVSEETIAAAAYIATYDRNSKQSDGLSYGWLLHQTLLSIFARDNNSFELFKVPNHAKSVRVANGYMYVNDVKYMPVHAQNGECMISRFDNNRAYALIKKICGNPVTPRVSKISAGAEYEIGVYGFSFANRETNNPQEWATLVEAYGVMDLVHDDKGSLCTAITDINGVQHILAQVLLNNVSKNNFDIDLLNKRVQVINTRNDWKTTEKTIKGVKVRVIA